MPRLNLQRDCPMDDLRCPRTGLRIKHYIVVARKRTQRNIIDQYKRVIVLLLEDKNPAEFGVANIDSAILCPHNAIASMQAIHRNLATLVDMAVPYGSPGQPQILEIPGLGK